MEPLWLGRLWWLVAPPRLRLGRLRLGLVISQPLSLKEQS
jgi:hypothetical protein